MSLVVGLDVGTSGLKALAVRDDGAVLASTTVEYPLYTPAPRFAEQDPADFARAAERALAKLCSQLGSDARHVAAIGLTGQMHSAVLLDENDAVLRRAMLWCDTRTTDACAEIRRRVGDDGLRRTARNLALEGFTLPKLLWLRTHEPDVFARIRRVLMPKDYVGAMLTGRFETDVSDASGTLAFDPSTRTWSRELLDALDLDSTWFPPAHESQTVLGSLRPEWSQRTGLPEGTPVIRGAADNAAGALGLAVVREGRAMASIGTSGVVFAHTDSLRVEPAMRLHAFCAAVPSRSYVMGVMLAAGGALRWFRDTIAHRDYDEITAAAAASRRGSRGVVFLPYLMGERTPHNDSTARGAFVGLTASADFGDLARSVLEGITFGLADSLALVRALDPPVKIEQIRLTGGGARSEMWRQLLADVFDAEVAVTGSTEGPAYGAAMLAARGGGLFDSIEQVADAWVKVTERREPSPDAARFYREAHAIYRGLYGDLRERFAAMARLD
jgi:xylulokinase